MSPNLLPCTNDLDCPGPFQCQRLLSLPTTTPTNNNSTTAAIIINQTTTSFCSCSNSFAYQNPSTNCIEPTYSTLLQQASIIISITWSVILLVWIIFALCRIYNCRRRKMSPKISSLYFCLGSCIMFISARSLYLDDLQHPTLFITNSYFYNGYKVSLNFDATFILTRFAWILVMQALLSVSISSVQILNHRKLAAGSMLALARRAKMATRFLITVRISYIIWSIVFLAISPFNKIFLWIAQLPFLLLVIVLLLILVIRTRNMITGVLLTQTKQSTQASKALEMKADKSKITEAPNHSLRVALKRLFSASCTLLILLVGFVSTIFAQAYYASNFKGNNSSPYGDYFLQQQQSNTILGDRPILWLFEIAIYIGLVLTTVLVRFILGYQVFRCTFRCTKNSRDGDGLLLSGGGGAATHRSKGFYISKENNDLSKLTKDTSEQSKQLSKQMSKEDLSKELHHYASSNKEITPRNNNNNGVPRVSLFTLDEGGGNSSPPPIINTTATTLVTTTAENITTTNKPLQIYIPSSPRRGARQNSDDNNNNPSDNSPAVIMEDVEVGKEHGDAGAGRSSILWVKIEKN
jgi:hypothetical protein